MCLNRKAGKDHLVFYEVGSWQGQEQDPVVVFGQHDEQDTLPPIVQTWALDEGRIQTRRRG